MRFHLAVCAMAAVITTEAAAKDKARPHFRKHDTPEGKLEQVAKKLQKAGQRVSNALAKKPRHLQDNAGF